MDNIIDSRFEEIKKIKQEKDSGKIRYIPFENYPKLSSEVPGIVKGKMSNITASSGIGKTKFAKKFFVIEPLKYAMKHNVKLKILYFALEESKGEFIDSIICNYISEESGQRIDTTLLQGYRTRSISQKEIDLIDKHLPSIKEMMRNIEVIDSIGNPYGIYAYCRDVADRNGDHFYEDREFIKKKSDGTIEKNTQKVYSHYTPYDEDSMVIVVLDHISLLTLEKDKSTGKTMTLADAMAIFTTKYALGNMTKHWNWHVCVIQQQAADSESEQFTNKGDSIQKKTEPSLSGLGDNKRIQRDFDLIIGVYSPDRYGFEEYHNYDIKRLRDTFRAAKILKSRWGPPNKYLHYLFDGATNSFSELPKASETAPMEPFYRKADVLLGRVVKPKQLKNFGQNG